MRVANYGDDCSDNCETMHGPLPPDIPVNPSAPFPVTEVDADNPFRS